MSDAAENERLISAVPEAQEDVVDRAIRPEKLDDYVGQEAVKKQMRIFIAAARQREDALDHTLIFGPPGLGKTTLANIIARELNVNLRHTSGPVLERPGDLAAMASATDSGFDAAPPIWIFGIVVTVPE